VRLVGSLVTPIVKAVDESLDVGGCVSDEAADATAWQFAGQRELAHKRRGDRERLCYLLGGEQEPGERWSSDGVRHRIAIGPRGHSDIPIPRAIMACRGGSHRGAIA
jgi:hypothetical protein